MVFHPAKNTALSAQSRPLMAAVIGWPIAHSLSPLLHSLWLERYGIHGYYIPVPCPPEQEQFNQLMRGLQVAGFSGCNVTLPHKKNALVFADMSSMIAQSVGAANILDFSYAGVKADNSDCAGFMAALAEELGEDLSGKTNMMTAKKALVIGAGGAAPAILKALEILKIETVILANRSIEKANTLKNQYPSIVKKTCSLEGISDQVGGVDLIVNTTSLGMSGYPDLTIDLSAARGDLIISDIIYTPVETKLLRDAKKRGLRYFGGLSMLIHQAVPSFEIFYGIRPAVTGEELKMLKSALNRGV